MSKFTQLFNDLVAETEGFDNLDETSRLALKAICFTMFVKGAAEAVAKKDSIDEFTREILEDTMDLLQQKAAPEAKEKGAKQ